MNQHLDLAERKRILHDWNATATDYSRNLCVHALFEAQAARTPDAVAVLHEGQQLNYAALNARANRLARCLLANGATAGARVAILLERSIDLVVAELAVLKCGAVYVPVDQAFPVERKQFMLADTGACVLLAHAAQSFPELAGVARIDIDTLRLDDVPPVDLPASVDSEAAAYIMYTSGSTGQAKGVVVPHRAINRLVLNCGYADFRADDRIAFAANPAFDAATMELWAPLLNGGCVVIISHEVLLDARRFSAALLDARVSVLWMTVGLFNQFAEAMAPAISRLRYLIVGGDALNPAAIAGVLQRSPPQHLINGYGPTETTTFAITHEIKSVSASFEAIPIGRPISNTQVYVLDEARQAVGIGVAGEIYIGGAGLALGYWNRPDLTAERFIPNPFGEGRLYRTGDVGRWRPEGSIDYLGRNDGQVKIRGFRIEVGEIEAQLVGHPLVRDALVVAREDSPGDKRLVAYLVLRQMDETAVDTLRAVLEERLPAYMLPAAYVVLDVLPLTPNGKPDRKALPAPAADAFGARSHETPEGETETLLAEIWAGLLGFERIGRHDDFFRLGGHSLYAARMITRVREVFEIDLKLATVFAAPVLSDLAMAIVDAQLAQFDQDELAQMGELAAAA